MPREPYKPRESLLGLSLDWLADVRPGRLDAVLGESLRKSRSSCRRAGAGDTKTQGAHWVANEQDGLLNAKFYRFWLGAD